MTTISFIDDVHGRYGEYLSLVRDCEYSLQLGDFGFHYEKVEEVDTQRHRFIPGNHDHYEQIARRKLDGWSFPVENDYGILNLAGTDIMYVRGGYSIDKMRRTPGFDWFPDEEISTPDLQSMIKELSKQTAKVVASHECPAFAAEELFYANPALLMMFGKYHPSRTAQALEALFEKMTDKPELWIFGHHHVPFDQNIQGTRFVCLPVLERFDYQT